MATEASGAGAAASGGTTMVIPGEMAARVDRLPRSAMAWEICLIVQIGWAVAVSTDAIAARMYPFIWLPAKEITHSQYDILYALEVGIGILLGGYSFGWLSDKVRPPPDADHFLGAGRGVHLAVRVRDELRRAGPSVDRQYARDRRLPGHQRGVHERDDGPGGPAPDHDGLSGDLHLPARGHPDRPHPALLVPQPVPRLSVAAGRAEHPGCHLPVVPDARITALAGSPGTPRQGPPGHGAAGDTGQQERPRPVARARPAALRGGG